MSFFEALRERAERGTWCKNSFWRKRRAEGIDATIEALNEMMVGEPQCIKNQGQQSTLIEVDCTPVRAGKEVFVVVFRIPKESE